MAKTTTVETKAEAELQKLKMMSPMSAEATVVRGYIDWMVQVPVSYTHLDVYKRQKLCWSAIVLRVNVF